MKFTTKTEYGLICLISMIRNGTETARMTVRNIAKRENLSQPYVEKIFQKLKAAGIVASHQGKDGGYALAQSPAAITLKAIIEALDGQTFEVYCDPLSRKDIVCTHLSLCELMPVWQKTRELLDTYYGSLTLEDLVRKEPQVHYG